MSVGFGGGEGASMFDFSSLASYKVKSRWNGSGYCLNRCYGCQNFTSGLRA